MLWCTAALLTSLVLGFSHVLGNVCAEMLSIRQPIPTRTSHSVVLESFVLRWTVLFIAALSQLASYCQVWNDESIFSLSRFATVIYPSFQWIWNCSVPVGGMRQLHDMPAFAQQREVIRLQRMFRCWRAIGHKLLRVWLQWKHPSGIARVSSYYSFVSSDREVVFSPHYNTCF